MERDIIAKTLEKYYGSKRKTARALGMSERTLYRKIKEYGLNNRV
ncbi:MAG: helix-turn-helix domain-containing protein [Candidatus Marinimicrobia bacterium]|nr:helix-turn-helix domain-containing protein [Candidatus Neomarinimicrobiota bacterium]